MEFQSARPSGLTVAQSRLVTSHLSRIRPWLSLGCYRVYVRALGRQDAYQVVYLALRRAAQGYDAGARVRFATYAAFWVRHFLQTEAAALARQLPSVDPAAISARPDCRQAAPDRLAHGRDRLRAAFACLDRRHRRVAAWRAQGYTHAEVGRRLGVGVTRACNLSTEALLAIWESAPHARA